MLVSKKPEDKPNAKFIGKNCGYNEYLVNVRENETPKKIINLDDGLYDDTFDYDPDNYDFDYTPDKDIEKDELSLNDFYTMDYKTVSYLLYRQINNLNTSINNIMEVLKK